MSWLNGWLWIAVAAVLAVVEVLAPGWIFLGTALAVLVMGLLLLAGLWPWSFAMALITAAILSGVMWLILRRFMGGHDGQVKKWTRDINDN